MPRSRMAGHAVAVPRQAVAEAPNALLLADEDSISPRPGGLLAGLTPAEREAVFVFCRRRVLKRHEILFEQATPNRGIYLIESGLIRVYYIAPSGREITRALWYPGNFVGGPDLFGRGVHQWSGRAVRASEVLFLPGAVLRRLVQKLPNLALSTIESLIFKSKCYSAQFKALGTCSAAERLERLLEHLTEMHGTPTSEGIRIDVNFTHEELSHLVGATRQWVTKTLKRLQREGIVAMRNRHIVLRQADHSA